MSDTLHVLILTQSRMPEPLIEKLRQVSARLAIDHRTAQSIEELGDGWRGIEVLYTSGLLPSPDLAPDLRWVQGHFAGVESFLAHPLLSKVTLTTSSGIHATPIAEYVMLMCLAFGHRLPNMLQHQQRSEWPEHRWQLFVSRELRAATLGVVGYGSIGREVARLAKAFGMRVLATKRNVQQADDRGWQIPEVGDPTAAQVDRLYAPEALHSMLAECDYVAVTVPLTPETRHLIGVHELKSMKSDAVLINIARGGVIDEAALIEALRSNTIGGAALDVFEQEPLPADSPLWKLPNVILSPHVSGFTPHYDERAMTLFAENLRRYVSGEPLLNVVDLSKGY